MFSWMKKIFRMGKSSYSAVLATFLKELSSLQMFLFSSKIESNALVVLLCGLRTWSAHSTAVVYFNIQLID